MSAEAKVAKLEGLLARIDGNRRPRPVGMLSALWADARSPASAEDDEPELVIEESETATVVAAKAPTAAATPMEAALAGEADDDEPELEIVVDDDDEPEMVIEEPDAPTAPLGTRAAKPAPDAKDTRPLRPKATAPATPSRPQPARPQPARPQPARPQPQAHAAQAGVPERLALAEAPVADVAKVVSQPTAISFGDLLDRTLALRPR